LFWIVVILSVFGFGFENILEAVADYYKFDKITNIERVYPENVTFPAITICYEGGYSRQHFRNGSLIRNDTVSASLLENFLKRTYFFLFKQNKSFLNVNNHLDIFKINHQVLNSNHNCLRFNAVTNGSVELFKASSTIEYLNISLNNFYRENISNVEYYNLNLNRDLFVYVGDNSLNSFENLKFLVVDPGSLYKFEIEKVTIENKLPEPYNLCKKSSVDEPYHQMNCIEALGNVNFNTRS
jgi:hypothetical protein